VESGSPAAAEGRDWSILRRYFSPRNEDSYRADLRTLAPVPGSFRPRVTRGQAKDALDRLEAKHGR
jgi:hypothetical protein